VRVRRIQSMHKAGREPASSKNLDRGRLRM
jgi:hypothetical protein